MSAKYKENIATGTLRARIIRYLIRQGVSVHSDGFFYLLDAVALCYEDEHMLNSSITKIIYPTVAKHYGVEWQAVERNIRYVLRKCPEHRTNYEMIRETVLQLKYLETDLPEYPFIVAWHRSSGSMEGYIERLVQKAIADDAPPRSVYYSRTDGRWITLDECCPDTIERLEKYVKIM